MRNILLTSLVAVLCSCQSGPDRSPGSAGASTVPVSTNAAQTVGKDQGSAQATETSTATASTTPTIYNLFGVKTATITHNADGSRVVEVEGSGEGELTIGTANMGVRFGDEGQSATSSTGGGAAGGTGSTARGENQ